MCLSLLGTWHGGDASEKWDPGKSNLLQVLLSIQGMILIPDPMFNEPGYEAIKGSAEGDVGVVSGVVGVVSVVVGVVSVVGQCSGFNYNICGG